MNELATDAPATREEILNILNRAFADRFHSLAEYILEAGPYIRDEDAALCRAIQRMAEYDRTVAERLADVIEELDGIPQVPAYKHAFTEMNYLSLHFLKNVLREELCKHLAAYERQLPFLDNCAAARNVLYSMCQALRGQIAELA